MRAVRCHFNVKSLFYQCELYTHILFIVIIVMIVMFLSVFFFFFICCCCLLFLIILIPESKLYTAYFTQILLLIFYCQTKNNIISLFQNVHTVKWQWKVRAINVYVWSLSNVMLSKHKVCSFEGNEKFYCHKGKIGC